MGQSSELEKPPQIVALENLIGQLLQVAGHESASRIGKLLKDLVESPKQVLQNGLRDSIRDAQYGLGAVDYHLSNIEGIEKAITEITLIDLANATVSSFRANRLDYEYQAYLFALRRTFEYLGNSVGVMFRCKVTSILEVSKEIKHADPVDLRNAVITVLDSGIAQLSDILGPRADGKKTVRNRVGHISAVPAGRLRIYFGRGNPRISIDGGGEELEMGDVFSKTETRLSPVLRKQVQRVESMIGDVYAAMGLL